MLLSTGSNEDDEIALDTCCGWAFILSNKNKDMLEEVRTEDHVVQTLAGKTKYKTEVGKIGGEKALVTDSDFNLLGVGRLMSSLGDGASFEGDSHKMVLKYDDKECKFLITHMEETSEKRKNLHAYFEKKDWVTIAPKCDFETYMDHINKHRFVCCPRGNGIDTYRFWECIYMGSVPIVESSPLDDLYSKVNCIIVESFFDLKKEQLDNFKYNDDLLSKEALLLKSYDSNISSINLRKS